jgi:outer membrane lipoprotein-sorting protein
MKRLVFATVLAGTLSLTANAGREFHWKSTMTIPGVQLELASETWVKGDRVRMVTQTPMGPSVTVVKGRNVYINAGIIAMKTTVDTAPSSTQPADFARNLDDLLKSGTKLGTETVDGEACEKWKTTRVDNGSSTELLLWLSPSLRFPRKVVVKDETRGEITMHNTDIENKVSIDDRLFEPDPGVNYQEMGEAMKSIQGGAPQK